MTHIHHTPYGIRLDWDPLLRAYGIHSGVLLHWQAMPRPPRLGADDRRNFGALVVQGEGSRYFTVPHACWECDYLGPAKLVQINQSYSGQVPTAAVWWPDAKLIHDKDCFRLV